MSIVSTPTGYTIRYDSNASGISFSGMQMIPAFAAEYDYFVWLSGSTYRAMNVKNGLVEYSGTDFSTVVQDLVDDYSGKGVNTQFSNQTMTVESPIVIPANNLKKFGFQGVFGSRSEKSTTLSVGSSFPTSGRYVFEHIGDRQSGATLFRSNVWIRDIFFTNSTNFGTIRAGGIRYESEGTTAINGVRFENLEFNLMSRGIHVIGLVFFGKMDNITFKDSTAGASGEFHMRLEHNYYGWDNVVSGQQSHSDYPKAFDIRNVHLDHAGWYQEGITIEGGYNKFYHIRVEGGAFSHMIWFRNAAFSNTIFGVRTSDTNTSPPGSGHHAIAPIEFDASGTFTGGFAFNTVDNEYQPSSGGAPYTVYSNKVYDAQLQPYLSSVAFKGSGFRNYVDLTPTAATTIINDSGAGANNVVAIRGGGTVATQADAQISGLRASIIDDRPGSDKRGFFQDSGGKAIYTIPHGLFGTPGFINVTPASPQAREVSGAPPSVSGGATNINVRYNANTQSGNVFMYWNAGVYTSV